MKRARIALLAALLCGNAPSRPPSASDKIIVAVQPLACAGVCPAFNLTVGSDGSLERHLEWGQRDRSSRISKQQYEAFERALAPLRNMAGWVTPCTRGYVQYDVAWVGAGRTLRVRSCDRGTSIANTVNRALQILKIHDEDGSLFGEADSLVERISSH